MVNTQLLNGELIIMVTHDLCYDKHLQFYTVIRLRCIPGYNDKSVEERPLLGISRRGVRRDIVPFEPGRNP